MATNEHRDCDRIILAGTLFYRLSQYEALTHLSAGHQAKQGRSPEMWVDKITIGESRDQILQAASRGAIRYADGDQCQPAKLFVIASARSGIRDALPDIFPGCKVGEWEPVVRMVTETLKGYAKAAYDELSRWVEEGGEGVFTFARMKKAIDLHHTGNFKRMRLNPDFEEAAATLGLIEHKPKKYATGWRLPQM